MAGLNKVFILGNLGRDPEVRSLPNGTTVCTFSIATSETWKGKTGEKREKTEWHRIVTFNKLADLCGEYLAKGRQVFVEGKLQTREWERDGVKQYTTEIIASEVRFIGGKNERPVSNKDDIPF